ncbi:N-6 DNA methylase [Saccharopolyspora sp. NPDC000359]|uniref:N-6 DNA methylase n=1 Tax=Saccharopolyspora sp. NPDC000359 TaxID=3154251 RepID=UPI003331C894
MPDRLSASGIARAAGVGRAAVSNWRERNPDFPEPQAGRFAAEEVAAWLDKRRIPRSALGAGESEGTTYGDRFRRALRLPGTAPSRPTSQSRGAAAKVREFSTLSLRDLRGYSARAAHQEWVLRLLRIRASGQWGPVRATLRRSVGTGRVATQLRALGLSFTEHLDPTRTMLIVESLDLVDDTDLVALLDGLLEDFAEFQRTTEFHTPRSVVRTAVELLQPAAGEEIYDPCCGTGGFLAAAADRAGTPGAIVGRTLEEFPWRAAQARLALRGAEFHVDHRNVLQHDVDRGRQFDVIMTNPPFSMGDWPEPPDDPRWRYGTPPRRSADFAWLQHVLDKVATGGRAAVVMPAGAAFRGGREAEIRRRMIEARAVEAVIELPAGLFRTTGIPVHLWLLRAPSRADGRVLFISAKERGHAISRFQQDLSAEDIADIVAAHQRHLGGGDVREPGFARSVDISEISREDFQLQPGTYLASPQARFHPAELTAAVAGQRQRLATLAHRATEVEALVHRQLDRIDLLSLESAEASPTVPLGEVCDVTAGPSGMLREIPADEHGVPVLTPLSLRRNRLAHGQAKGVAPTARERLARYLLKTDDVLCSRTGTVGRVALVTADHEGSLFGPGFLRLRPLGPELSSHYLLHYLASEQAQDWVEQHSTSSTIPSLSAKAMRQLPIPLPPPDRQAAIVEIMASLDEQLALRDEVADATERLKHQLGLLVGADDFPLRDQLSGRRG